MLPFFDAAERTFQHRILVERHGFASVQPSQTQIFETTKVFTSGAKHLYRRTRLMTVGLSARSQLCCYVPRRTGLACGAA
jgi:hypothetical protein